MIFNYLTHVFIICGYRQTSHRRKHIKKFLPIRSIMLSRDLTNRISGDCILDLQICMPDEDLQN